MPVKNVTINDVAAAAGVSRQTVTRAMNAMADISPATRERVLDAAERLGYRPSRFASNLPAQKHRTIGIVVESLRNPYYTDLAADLIDVTAEHGWQTTIATLNPDIDQVVRDLERQVDAIVGYATPSTELLRGALRGLPIVRLDADERTTGMHAVTFDFETGMRQLIEQARARGSRRFAMIDSTAAGTTSTLRGAVLRRMAPIEHVEMSELTIEDGARALIRLRDAAPHVDTVVAFNDMIAIGAIVGAHQQGVRVPEDLRIIGIDGLTLGEIMDPPLSTLAIDRLAVAHAAADIIARQFAQPGGGFLSVSITPRPIWRKSA